MDSEQSRASLPRRRPDMTIAEELIALDLDIMKMLARRARLVSRMRGGKNHAATPVAVLAEKEVRCAWEKHALRFSRDGKLSRRLFSLLQELEIDSRETLESRAVFTLAPSRKPVALSLAGPVSVTGIRLRTALAASFGAPMQVDNVLLSDPLVELVKSLNQAGAHISWAAHGRLENAAGGKLVFADKVFFAGEDALNFYLLALLAVNSPGKTRFTGGSALKMADLSAFRRFLPALGARLAHTVPRSCGLPAGLEASGLLPDSIVAAADLPREAVVALLTAVCAWEKPVQVDLSQLPPQVSAGALAEVTPLLQAGPMQRRMPGGFFAAGASPAAISAARQPAMDPAVAAYLLALPAFAGGEVSLAGLWDEHHPLAAQALQLLRAAALAVVVSQDAVTATYPAESAAFAYDCAALPPELYPLGAAFSLLPLWRGAESIAAPSPPAHEAREYADDFFAYVGLVGAEGRFRRKPASSGGDDAALPAWISPDPWWSMAFALAAYLRPRLRLANPGVMTLLMPGFWALYNALPNPAQPRARGAESPSPPPARRRVIANN